MTSHQLRSLRVPLAIHISKREALFLPAGTTGIQMWLATTGCTVEVTNTQYQKGTRVLTRLNFPTEEVADREISSMLVQIDTTYVDTRARAEHNAKPILEFLATSPSDPAALAAVMGTPESLNAGAYLLARSLGHISGPLSYVCWSYFGSMRPDCWQIRTISVAAEMSSNVGTPMHRYGGDPSYSESIISSWLPVAPEDPARALAEAMLYDGGPQGIIHGYDHYTLNAKRRAGLRQAP